MEEGSDIDKTVFEGAGFLFTHKDDVVVVTRINPDPDAVLEFEYVGGKVEGDETPDQTAFAEHVEELGMNVIDKDWIARAEPLHTFQPFSKKWIWCYRLELNHDEFERLCQADQKLASWPSDEKRCFGHLTGRSELARKAVGGVCVVKWKDLDVYVRTFAQIPADKNRMKQAKQYAKDNKLVGHSIMQDKSYIRGMRGFNLVVMEKHFK